MLPGPRNVAHGVPGGRRVRGCDHRTAARSGRTTAARIAGERRARRRGGAERARQPLLRRARRGTGRRRGGALDPTRRRSRLSPAQYKPGTAPLPEPRRRRQRRRGGALVPGGGRAGLCAGPGRPGLSPHLRRWRRGRPSAGLHVDRAGLAGPPATTSRNGSTPGSASVCINVTGSEYLAVASRSVLSALVAISHRASTAGLSTAPAGPAAGCCRRKPDPKGGMARCGCWRIESGSGRLFLHWGGLFAGSVVVTRDASGPSGCCC